MTLTTLLRLSREPDHPEPLDEPRTPGAPGLNALQTVKASGKEFLFWADYPFFGTTFPTIDFYRVKLFPFLSVNSVAFYPQMSEIR